MAREHQTVAIFLDYVGHAKMTPALAEKLVDHSRVPVTVLQRRRLWRNH